MTRLGIDIDGVLANFTYPAAALANEMFGLQASGHATHWNWMRDYGLVGDKEKKFWTHLTSTPEWWERLPVLPQAVDAIGHLNALSQSGSADVYFITTRHGAGMKRAAERWLESQGYVRPTVLMSKAKGLVASGLQLDFFADDRPENCVDVLQYVTATYLIERPWNEAFEAPDGLRRAPALSAALAEVGLVYQPA